MRARISESTLSKADFSARSTSLTFGVSLLPHLEIYRESERVRECELSSREKERGHGRK